MAIELNIYIRGADWRLARHVCCRADPTGQLLQRLEMLIRENTGCVGKNFQNSGDITIAIDRNDCYRADSDCLRNLRVNAAVDCDVLTTQWCSRIQTLLRDSGGGVDRSTERRRSLARSCPAYRSLLSPERDCRSTCACQNLCQLHNSTDKALEV